MKSAKKGRGFTLIELLIVIIIIGILATLAIPQYTKMVERARQSEARTVLGTMRTGQVLYHTEYSTYTTSDTELERFVDVPEPDSIAHYFKYTIPIGTTTDYSVRATRKLSSDTGKSPPWTSAYTITMFQNGTVDEVGAP